MKTSPRQFQATVKIAFEDIQLEGFLNIPPKAKGVVVFAHGSGSSRFSPRNQFVADYLYQKKLGFFLFDLLTLQEEQEDRTSGIYRFNISFLSQRLAHVTRWLMRKLAEEKFSIPLGFFGASTGAAAAMAASVDLPEGAVAAIVSRGGRPDLANDALHKVKAPTLLIVGSNDLVVFALNREAFNDIRAPKEFFVVKGAAHLFEEPGAMEAVAQKTFEWFDVCFKQA